jgi:hypothetical protein
MKCIYERRDRIWGDVSMRFLFQATQDGTANLKTIRVDNNNTVTTENILRIKLSKKDDK